MNIFNHKHLVGQPVYSTIFGNGKIVGASPKDENLWYTVKVAFQLDGSKVGFTEDGKAYRYEPQPQLSFGHKDLPNHDYGIPKLKDIFMEPNWCWVANINVLNKVVIRDVLAVSPTGYVAIIDGASRNGSTSTTNWRYAIRLTSDELASERFLKRDTYQRR